MIVVSFVHDHIHMDKKGKYCVQFAGVSDKPSMLMELQSWTMPHETMEEAIKQRDDFKKKISKMGDTFLVILTSKK